MKYEHSYKHAYVQTNRATSLVAQFLARTRVDAYFLRRSVLGFYQEDFVTEKIVDLEKFTEKSLQFSANILGGRAARAKLM